MPPVPQKDDRIDMDAKRVLFVCMGNICRSPAAEAVMQRFAEEAGVSMVVESAGTHDYHVGEKADRRMRAAAEDRGYSVLSRGRHVADVDLEPGSFDLVLAMDEDNYRNLRERSTADASHLRLFSDYLDEEWPRNVPDPYYGG
ncbi:MAG: low molecular weight protein-tyrosine-phosphatase, partial [Planctomycetota bacterium]